MAKVILDSGNNDIIRYFLDSHPNFDLNTFRDNVGRKELEKDANIKKLNSILSPKRKRFNKKM